MIARILLVAIAAGIIAGAFVTIAQSVRAVPLILQAETYETGEPAAATAVDKTAVEAPAHAHDGTEVAGHSHEKSTEWAPQDGLQRIAFTLMANILLGVGFSLLLTAAIVMAGVDISLKTGILWGLAGFLVFTVSPTIGLPPEAPGMVAADIIDRQIWWGGAVISAAIGLALMVFGKSPVFKILGLAILVLPHVIGAPHPDLQTQSSNLPAELAIRFVMATLLSTGLFWLVLGASVGGLLQRFGKPA